MQPQSFDKRGECDSCDGAQHVEVREAPATYGTDKGNPSVVNCDPDTETCNCWVATKRILAHYLCCSDLAMDIPFFHGRIQMFISWTCSMDRHGLWSYRCWSVWSHHHPVKSLWALGHEGIILRFKTSLTVLDKTIAEILTLFSISFFLIISEWNSFWCFECNLKTYHIDKPIHQK